MDTVSTHGLQLSRMTLGTVQLGMPYGVANQTGQPSLKDALHLLAAARKGGVNCLDTARAYGQAEQVLGAFFARSGLGSTTVVTKFCIDPEKGTDPVQLRRQVEESARASMQALGVTTLPMLMAHHADDLTVYGPAVNEALADLRAEGLVRHTGASVYTAGQIDRVLEQPGHTLVQLPLNALDVRLVRSGHLLRLREAGCMVFVRSVFLQGLFFLRDFHGAVATAQPYVERLRDIAKDAGMDVAALALCYARDLPGVTSLVLGAETVAQVEENIRLMQAPPLDAGVRQAVEQLADKTPIEAIMAALSAR